MIQNPSAESFEYLKHQYDFWQPEPKQIEFAQIPYSVFEGFYGGALGGGKSEILTMLPIIYRMHEHPRFHGMFFRRTKSQHDETLFSRARYYYGKVGGVPNETKMLFTFPSGAVIRFTYLERDEHARDHDGAEYHYVAFDELTHFTEFQYIYITTRIRRSIDELPVIIRSASNPGNIGHAWVRARFIEPCKTGGKILKDSKGNKRIFIKSKLSDNKYITENDPEYVQRLEIIRQTSEAEYLAKVEGDWWVYSGQVFTEFRDERRVNEPENALHVIPPFKIPYYWPKILAIDWGWEANNWVGSAAISPDGRIYLYNEHVINRTTISKWTAMVQTIWLPEIESIRSVFIDPSSRRHDGQAETSIFEQIQQGLGPFGSKLELADNDRLSGKLQFHELLRWKQLPPVKNVTPGGFNEELFSKIYRNFGEKAALDYKVSFEPQKPELNIPRLQIFSNCEEIIKTIPLCIYNETKGTSRRNKKYEDVAEFDGDDAYDGGRYLLKGVERYIAESGKLDSEYKKLDAIHQHLIETNDQTSYYRLMEKLEAEKRKYHGASVKRSNRRLLTR